MRKFLAGLLVVVLLGVPGLATAQVDPAAQAKDATVEVFGRDDQNGGVTFQCSATYVEALPQASQYILITAGHCKDINVLLDKDAKGRSKFYLIRCVGTDTYGYDAAVCVTDHPNSRGVYTNQISTDYPLSDKTRIVTYGFGEGAPQTNYGTLVGYGKIVIDEESGDGYIAPADPNEPGAFAVFQMDTPIKRGQSGSAVYDLDGRLVGILVYGMGSNDCPSPDGFGCLMGATTVPAMLKVASGQVQ